MGTIAPWTLPGVEHSRGEPTKTDDPLLQHSFHDLDTDNARITPYANGLVNSIIRAFQQDLHLVLRPHDIWLSILTQFSMYVNGNAEELRQKFVSHEGIKSLNVDVRAHSVWSMSMGHFAQLITNFGTGFFPSSRRPRTTILLPPLSL